MKTLKRENTIFEFERLSEHHSLQSSSLQLEVMGSIATTTYKRLASLLADKWGTSYSQPMGWLRCRLSFSLLRSSMQCIRGVRSNQDIPPYIELTVSESMIPLAYCYMYVCMYKYCAWVLNINKLIYIYIYLKSQSFE